MSNGFSGASTTTRQAGTAMEANGNGKWWSNPYLMGSLALTITAVLSLTFSLLLVCRRLHHHHCSLFLVEMAVGSLTTEAIVHLLPALVLTDSKPRTSSGMPVYFPHLATVTAGVCLLHALDTASIVFFGRRQSTSHAMEWRNDHHRQSSSATAVDAGEVCDGEGEGDEAKEESSKSLTFEDENQDPQVTRQRARGEDITLRQALANPRLCLQPGPYRLCSILTAGSMLHSFADGVAIGAAFVKSWESGLQLSLSVGMHELAHKVADFSVLTASGFSRPAVILLNLCYWTSAFVGLFVSVPLSQKSDSLRAWIMTVATAVFVYISLVTMSSMVRKNYLPHHISAFIIGNLGMTVGFLLIMLASFLEFFY